jgi:hypothetical protein
VAPPKGSATLQDSRNTSTSGPYAAPRGDRIPNRPYAFGSASLELRYPGLVVSGDSISATWISRYVHAFYRTWESLGSLELLVPRSTAEADIYDVDDIQTTVYSLSGANGSAMRLFTMPGYLSNAIRLR